MIEIIAWTYLLIGFGSTLHYAANDGFRDLFVYCNKLEAILWCVVCFVMFVVLWPAPLAVGLYASFKRRHRFGSH